MVAEPELFDDFRDMLLELAAAGAGAEHLVVGGHAVAAHGVVRGTLGEPETHGHCPRLGLVSEEA